MPIPGPVGADSPPQKRSGECRGEWSDFTRQSDSPAPAVRVPTLGTRGTRSRIVRHELSQLRLRLVRAVRLSYSTECQIRLVRLLVLLPSFGGIQIGLQGCCPLPLVQKTKGLFVRKLFGFVPLPLSPFLALFVGMEPIGRGSIVLDAVDQEGCGRNLEAGKSSRVLVHCGIRNPDPSLNDMAAMVLQKTPGARRIDADLPERLNERIVRNRILLAYRASGEQRAEILGTGQNSAPLSGTCLAPPQSLFPCSSPSRIVAF